MLPIVALCCRLPQYAASSGRGSPFHSLAAMKISATAFVMLFAAMGCLADSVVPASVQSVASGGYWQAEGKRGVYRVVIVNAGYEHVTSRVLVEWLQDPSSADEESKVISAVEPQLPFGNNVASLSASLKPLGSGRVQVMVSGVVTAEPTRKVAAVLLASQPGQVSVVAKPPLQRSASGAR
ncbi:MAG: hypothetical protein AB7I35_08745 [Ramlibacter sp.]